MAKSKVIYEDYRPLEELVRGLNNGSLSRSTLRINQKNHVISFVTGDSASDKDILIEGTFKNRALNGDQVAYEILPKDQWKLRKTDLALSLVGGDKSGEVPVQMSNEVKYRGVIHTVHTVEEQFLQRTAKVVGILEKVHTRKAMGYAKGYNQNFAMFSPIDSRVPRLLIPLKEFPAGFRERPKDYDDNLMVAKVDRWERDGKFAFGTLLKAIGSGTDDLVESATEGILDEYGLDASEFPDDINTEIPDFQITAQDVADRSKFDFRKKCVFTIDPATARDLDDACSVEKLPNGNYEIGVHIADVSHFVLPGTRVDEIARERTTSIYMVQKVIPMLPRKLCENLCSLVPGVDRFSFSVVWEMTGDGKVLSTKFGKSLICSCAKLHYAHAQDMIEAPEREFAKEDLPEISNGFTAQDLSWRVNVLHRIAQIFRAGRKEKGSISIQQCKLSFALNETRDMPLGLGSYKSKESNKLIEEFMLKANESVATKLYECYPGNAILRRHPGPKENVLESSTELLKRMGLEIDTSSSKGMQEALNAHTVGGLKPTPTGLVIASLLAKAMTLATYHSSGEFEDFKEYHHYGLSMDLYTHFTSPIRRYPDLIAHRQLQAILEDCQEEDGPMSFDEVSEIAERSSGKKFASKQASDKSGELFLWLFVREQGLVLEEGVVIEIGDQSIDILVLRFGLQVRVWRDFLGDGAEFQSKEKHWAHISWPAKGELKAESVRYQLLDKVVVGIKAGKQLFKTSGVLPRPGSLAGKDLVTYDGVYAPEDV
eukprot:sb/3462314/